MGATLKIILLIIAILGFVGCIFWWYKEGGWEPKVAILGAISTLIVLIYDLSNNSDEVYPKISIEQNNNSPINMGNIKTQNNYYLKEEKEGNTKNYSISNQDNNVRGFLLPPEKFQNGSVYFDLGGGNGKSYSLEVLRNGNPGQPETHEGYRGIHVLTYNTPTIPFGSILSLHVSDDNYLTVSAKFYNENGELVGAIKDNNFISVRKSQVSWNFDDNGFEIIDNDMHVNLLVDYSTGNSVKIRGILGYQTVISF